MNGRVAYYGVAFVLLGAALLVSPTLGFETIAADRTTQIETASDHNALVGFEVTSGSINGRQDSATVFSLRNNAEETLTFATDTTIDTGDVRVVAGADGSGTVAPGASTDVRIECDGGGGTGTATVTTVVTEASGNTLVVEGASSSTTVEYECRGGGQPGAGFADVSVQDVSTYTAPGDDRQQVSFTPADDLRPNGQVTIDLSAAHPSGVDYTQINWDDSNVNVVEGNGEITQVTQQGVITYETGNGANSDPGGEQVVISVGGYETTTAAGPFEAEITREDSGETGTDPFYVVDDGSSPITDVSVENVPANADPDDPVEQTFSFTLGMSMNYEDEVIIDVSQPQGEGVDYSRTMSWHEFELESGQGYIEPRSSEAAFVYHPSDGDDAGDEITFTASGFETASSGGPWDVAVTYAETDTGDSDSFRID